MFCPSCGKQLPDQAKFCDQCGERLPDAIPEPVVPPAEPPAPPRVPEAPPAPPEEPTVRFKPVSAPAHSAPAEEPTVRFKPVSAPQQPGPASAPPRPARQPGGRRTPSNRAVLIAVIAAAVVVVAVVLCILFLGDGEPQEEPRDSGQMQLLPIRTPEPTPAPTPAPTPTPEPTPAPTPVPRLLDEAELEAVLYAAAPEAVAGAYVLDLNTGEGYAAGAGYGQMSASALVNIPVLFTVAEQIQDGILTMNDTVEFRYTLAGRASLDASLDGDYMMVWELLEAMLMYSDNNAANSLIRFLGYDTIEEYCHAAGFSSVQMEVLIGGTTDTADNYVSCADVAGMLRMLWEDETGIGGAFLESAMQIQDFTARQGLGAQLPEGGQFLNHNGYRGDLYNEAAIVHDGSAAYIIVFMAKDQDWTQLAAAAGEVNRFVYDAFQG